MMKYVGAGHDRACFVSAWQHSPPDVFRNAKIDTRKRRRCSFGILDIDEAPDSIVFLYTPTVVIHRIPRPGEVLYRVFLQSDLRPPKGCQDAGKTGVISSWMNLGLCIINKRNFWPATVCELVWTPIKQVQGYQENNTPSEQQPDKSLHD
jgi:hypothetical protein